MLRELPVREPSRLAILKGRQSALFPEWNYPVWLQLQQWRALFDAVAVQYTARLVPGHLLRDALRDPGAQDVPHGGGATGVTRDAAPELRAANLSRGCNVS